MTEPTSPSPPPRPEQRSQSHLPSSNFSTPSLSSSLPLPRQRSVSVHRRRESIRRRGRTGSSQRRRHARSVTSSVSHGSDGDGSLGDFSMENYTIDLAQLGRKVGGAPMIGAKQGNQDSANEHEAQPVIKDGDDIEQDDSDYFEGDYSIDLGALGEKPSSVVVENREPERDVVDSEDDGPEDFTLNLEKWMRGTEKWKKEREDKEYVDDHDRDDDQQKQGQAGLGDPLEESVFEPVGTSTPAPLQNHAIIEKGVQEEARIEAPPLSRLNTEELQDKAAEEVFDRIAALQAEVEKMRIEEENRRLAYHTPEKEHQKIKLEHNAARERDQAKHDALYLEHEQLKQVHRGTQETLRQENEQLRKDYDDAIKQHHVSAQASSPTHDSESAESATKELAIVKAKAEADEMAAGTKIEALKTELQASQDESTGLRAEVESMRAAHNLQVKDLTAELEARKNEVALERKESIHRGNESASLSEIIEQKDKEIYALNGEFKAIKMELEHAQEQLAETRRIMETVEDENDRLMQQNDRQAEDIADLKLTIKSDDSKERMVDTATIREESQNAPSSREARSIDKATYEAALEALCQQHQEAISLLRTTHDKEVQVLRSALTKASQAMQKREAKLTRAHEDEIIALKNEVAALKQSAKASVSSNTGVENELRSAIRVLNSKLEKANALLASTRAEAADARQKAEDVENRNAIVNAELEARFTEAVEAREKEWRRRIDLLFRERDRMGKALMWGWGREEVGPKAPNEREQGYRYKYVTR